MKAMVYDVQSSEIQAFLTELEYLHQRHELAQHVSPGYFEPGMMEYLDQSEGVFDTCTRAFRLRFEVKGTRYEGRTEQIERVKLNDEVLIQRDADNIYNHNNFRVLTSKGRDLGNVPANLCNAIAPLYDCSLLEFTSAKISYVAPLSVRNRHAKQAVLFIEVNGILKGK